MLVKIVPELSAVIFSATWFGLVVSQDFHREKQAYVSEKFYTANLQLLKQLRTGRIPGTQKHTHTVRMMNNTLAHDMHFVCSNSR